MNLEPYSSFIRELATLSANEILPRFRKLNLGIEEKADETPVTIADRRAEEVMRDRIQKRFPEHGIVGEEFGNVRAEAEWVWVLDPIDGTKSFITGVPLFGTLIGLLHQGRPLLGCIHQPVLQQLMLGDGKQTTLNGEIVRVRNRSSLEEATLLTTDPANLANYQNGDAFNDLVRRVKLYRTFGDCYGYLLLASGWADIMTDAILNPWDLLPVVPVIEGAGGKITDWNGRAIQGLETRSAVASLPELHEEVLKVLNPAQ